MSSFIVWDFFVVGFVFVILILMLRIRSLRKKKDPSLINKINRFSALAIVLFFILIGFLMGSFVTLFEIHDSLFQSPFLEEIEEIKKKDKIYVYHLEKPTESFLKMS